MDQRLLSAPMHAVEVRWTLKSGRIVIGPEPRLILHVHALRDVEALTLLVKFHGLPDGLTAAESLLMTVPAVHGVRQLKPTDERWVIGRENLPVPDEGTEVLNGGYNLCPSEHGYGFWVVQFRIDVPKGLCIGLVARSEHPGECEVQIGGA